jgi:hypothetical protein
VNTKHGIPHRKKKGRNESHGKLKEEHLKFIIKHIDKNPTADILPIKDSSCKGFLGLEINKSVFH